MNLHDAILARAEILHWLINRWTFEHEQWITGWQAESVCQQAGIEIDHEGAMNLLMTMGNEGYLVKPEKGRPITWRLPKPLMLRRLIAHKPTSGAGRERFLKECLNLLGIEHGYVARGW